MIDRAENLEAKLARLSELALRGATPGERAAARAGVSRVQARIAAGAPAAEIEEITFSFTDPWSRQLFVALCHKHGLRPMKGTGQGPNEFMLLLDAEFVERVFWPEYEALASELDAALDAATEDIAARIRHRP